jgi:hypothetical protein
MENPVIDKIKKLFALAAHPSTNVNEAAAAAGRAQALLFANKLSMAEIEVNGGKPAEAVGQLNLDARGKAHIKWKASLMSAVGRGCYCKVIQSVGLRNDKGETICRLMIIGKPSDAQTVQYLYTYLVSEIERLCASLCWGMGATYENSFRLGAVAAIYQRFTEQRTEQERANAPVGSALAVIKNSDNEIKAFVAEKFGRLGKVARARVSNGDGYGAGVRAGRDVNLGGNKRLGAAPGRIEA